jgi:DnaJ-class molecular chaperone
MYDLSVPNAKPGPCEKCKGSGLYRWGASVNGVSAKSGTCFSCRGTGLQNRAQIARNQTYNRHKIAAILHADFAGQEDRQ